MINTSRFDYVFSYWILVWFLLYYYRIVHSNPKWLLIVALVQNLIGLFFLIKHKYTIKFILTFIFINTIIKVVPLILIMNTKVNTIDIIYYLVVFFFYLLYMYYNQQNGIDYIISIDSIKNKEYSTPLMGLFNRILNKNT
jgi:hypothetical protein